MTIPFDFLLPLLCCPKCRSSLKPVGHGDVVLLCTGAGCRLQFKIQDEIPVLNAEFAEQLSPEQWQPLVS